MLSANAFHDLVSGRRRGVLAALLRGGLRLLEIPYGCAMAWRNRRYDRAKSAIHRVGVPVISVGNLTAGGTGKTPLVEWLARWFRKRSIRVTLISRGYRAAAGARNDEALELEQRLPDVPHLQHADRAWAAETAIEEFQCQLIVLDDAFQHRRIHRDLDIVLIDALQPFGHGHLLPRGLLREPLASLARADVVALSRSDLIPPAERAGILECLRRHAPNAWLVEIAHTPRSLLAWPGDHTPTARLAGASIAAFCGIGNPDGFRRTLERCGCKLVAFHAFPDHHPYCRSDIEWLHTWARGVKTSTVVCTHKDLVKIQLRQLGGRDLRALVIGTEVIAGQQGLETRLQQLLVEWEIDPGTQPD